MRRLSRRLSRSGSWKSTSSGRLSGAQSEASDETEKRVEEQPDAKAPAPLEAAAPEVAQPQRNASTLSDVASTLSGTEDSSAAEMVEVGALGYFVRAPSSWAFAPGAKDATSAAFEAGSQAQEPSSQSDPVAAQQAWLAKEQTAEEAVAQPLAPESPPPKAKLEKRPSWARAQLDKAKALAAKHVPPVSLRPNQSPNASKQSPPSLNTSSLLAAAHVQPVSLRPNQSPLKRATTAVHTLYVPAARHAPPVSLRPNFAPVQTTKRAGNGSGFAVTAADALTGDFKPGSGVSASIFDREFAEPAGREYTYNYDQLNRPIDQLPGGVDPRKREQYLSDADFERILGMSRAEFGALKKWRQNEIKRKANLF